MTTPEVPGELPLIGLVDDTLLPGETRELGAPVIERAALERLRSAAATQLAIISVTTPAELPALVAARWATIGRVLRVDDEQLVVLGERRARIKEARGGESPYRATLLPVADSESSELSELLREAHRLIAALDLGGRADKERFEDALRSALVGLVRATMSPAELGEAANLPLHESLRKQAQLLAVGRAVEAGSCELEAALLELAEQPSLSKAQRQRLWSQVVAIQRRLDIYEPTVADSDTTELTHLQKRLQQAGLPKAARVVAKSGLRLLRGMPTSDHDYSTRLGHLEFMASLPWCRDVPPKLSVAALEAQLDREHFGLGEPKRRILEYFAVRELGGRAAGTVLCLAGPPGVGKTSLARSIARALERPLVRVALGGVHEESEIRGHRLSFVAAAPGRILRGVAEAGSMSCVMLLDELDKVDVARGRSPAAALLEVLDAEQNHSFRDNYLGTPYDLSDVLFICTANDVSRISGPLRDRLEIIDLEGYTLAEKTAIARQHLLERVAADCGLAATPSADAIVLEHLIDGYTREAGVRELSRKLGAIFRARALQKLREGRAAGGTAAEGTAAEGAAAEDVAAEGGASAPPAQPVATDAITLDEIAEVLGPPKHRRRARRDVLPMGVAIGLAVDAMGGSTLYVEVGWMPGKGEVRSTGKLGEVMRESVFAALGHIKLAPGRYGVDERRLRDDLHVHLPEAAIAKDGPSAGIALFAALLSALREQPLPADIGMTGELTLTGDVLAVGGMRAKLLAAERAGLRRVLVPEDNRADVPRDVALDVVFVERVEDALAHLFAERSSSSEVA